MIPCNTYYSRWSSLGTMYAFTEFSPWFINSRRATRRIVVSTVCVPLAPMVAIELENLHVLVLLMMVENGRKAIISLAYFEQLLDLNCRTRPMDIIIYLTPSAFHSRL